MKRTALILLALMAAVVLHAQSSVASVDHIFSDTSVCEIKKLPVNSEASDFGTCPYNNGYLFSSSRSHRNMISHTHTDGSRLFDLYYFERAPDGNCSQARIFSRQLTTRMNEGSATVTSDGLRIIYTANRTDVAGRARLALFESVRTGARWSEPVMIGFCKPEYNYEQAFISGDTLLYFVSDRDGGAGGKDIWIARRANEQWTEPVNAGTAVNTPANEVFPFVSRNGTFYFSSDRAGGMGGLDIYHYRRNEYQPMLLRGIINSSADDFAFSIDDEKLQGFFSSDRGDDPQDDNIYFFDIKCKYALQPDTVQNVVLCYVFTEEASAETGDTALMKYSWTFSDGTKQYGYSVKHSFDTLSSYTGSARQFRRRPGDQ